MLTTPVWHFNHWVGGRHLHILYPCGYLIGKLKTRWKNGGLISASGEHCTGSHGTTASKYDALLAWSGLKQGDITPQHILTGRTFPLQGQAIAQTLHSPLAHDLPRGLNGLLSKSRAVLCEMMKNEMQALSFSSDLKILLSTVEYSKSTPPQLRKWD